MNKRHKLSFSRLQPFMVLGCHLYLRCHFLGKYMFEIWKSNVATCSAMIQGSAGMIC